MKCCNGLKAEMCLAFLFCNDNYRFTTAGTVLEQIFGVLATAVNLGTWLQSKTKLENGLS